VIEHLPGNPEALSSIPSAAQNKTKQNNKQETHLKPNVKAHTIELLNIQKQIFVTLD
jgi:hypothetical protein